jgi:hypothetical protein
MSVTLTGNVTPLTTALGNVVTVHWTGTGSVNTWLISTNLPKYIPVANTGNIKLLPTASGDYFVNIIASPTTTSTDANVVSKTFKVTVT